jgi:hypothetical protein
VKTQSEQAQVQQRRERQARAASEDHVAPFVLSVRNWAANVCQQM